MNTVLRYIAVILFIAVVFNSIMLIERFGIDPWSSIAWEVIILTGMEMAVLAGIAGFFLICLWILPHNDEDF